MKLETVKITNFRGISECAEVNFKDLTAIVGKNDVGKSTILEALDIFFNGNSAESKIGAMDINQYVRKKCDGKIDIEIACVFSDIPQGDIVLDDSASTSLNNEGLAVDGKLEIVKIYPNAGKAKVCVRAKYPNVGGAENLFLCKNTDLKKLASGFNIECKKVSSNVALREDIRRHMTSITSEYKYGLMPLNDQIAEKVEALLPRYELFRADRINSVEDDEVQNPLMTAVQAVFNRDSITKQLREIGQEIDHELRKVLGLMEEKIREFNPNAFSVVSANMPNVEKLKWWSVYKGLSLIDGDGIALDKRGSGIRRMMLLSFFQVESELANDNQGRGCIYAIEEPETAQHADSQVKIVETLKKLSNKSGTQVILTTHSGLFLKCLHGEDFVWKLSRTNALDFGINVVAKKEGKTLVREALQSIEYNGVLPYLSYSEIACMFLGECVLEYHEELYGFLESNGLEEGCNAFAMEKYPSLRKRYTRRNGEREYGLPRYVRDMIHHPENERSSDLTEGDMDNSIGIIRAYLVDKGFSQIEKKAKSLAEGR